MDKFGRIQEDFSKFHQIAGTIVSDEAVAVDDDVKNSKVLTEVPVVRIAEYIRDVVGTRQIPQHKEGKVVMKLDVEVNLGFFCNANSNQLVSRARRWR